MRRAGYNEKRKAIIDSSLLLFFESGFSNVNLQMMLQKAEVSKGTFYHYFNSKDGVIDECREQVLGYFLEQVNGVINSTQMCFAEKINFFIRWPASFVFLNTHGCELSLTQFMSSDGNHELRQTFESSYKEAIYEPLRTLLLNATQQGESELSHPDESARLLAMIIMPLIYAVPASTLQVSGKEDMSETLLAGLECIERTLKLAPNSMRNLAQY